MAKIIGIVGPKGSGKSTLAMGMARIWDGRVVKLSFAEPLRRMVSAGLDIPYSLMLDTKLKEEVIQDYGQSARYILQTLGTEWGRKLIHPDIWITAWERAARAAADDRTCEIIVTDDVRFQNEADKIRLMGGKLIRIHRENFEVSGEHESELEAAKISCDATFYNTSPANSDEFYEKLESVVYKLFG